MKVDVYTNLVGAVVGFETVTEKITINGQYYATYSTSDVFVGGTIQSFLDSEGLTIEEWAATEVTSYDYYTTRTDSTGEIIYELYTRGSSGTAYSSTHTAELEVTYQQISGDKKFGKLCYVTVKNDVLGTEFKINMSPNVSLIEWKDIEENVIYNFYSELGSSYSTYDEAKAACDSKTLDPADFYDIVNDYVSVSVNGTTKQITENSYIGADSDMTETVENITVPLLENKSVGVAYPSESYHYILWEDGPDAGNISRASELAVNDVRVHTPVHNEISLDTLGANNQFDDEDIVNNEIKANDAQILKLGDSFEINVSLSGDSYYYSGIITDLAKYVSKIEIDCPFCSATTVNLNSLVHKCDVPPEMEDNKMYEVIVKVYAENKPSSNTNIQNQTTNDPDDYYIIAQSANVYVVGKIYDLEVRTVDDPGWRLSKAEKLAKLPTGEFGDNAVSSYKYGIKLGYRAYFDLKTLGVENQSITIIPKIYYVTKNGEINENVTLYYQTSKTEYKKLSEDDISIIMKMTTTQGDVNNSDFKRELVLTKVAEKYKLINSLNDINIGGLSEITLNRENSTITKYEGKEYTGDLCDVSRRWYGEVYMPASTVVVDNSVIPEGTKISTVASKISQGKGVLSEGYLLITFDTIISNDASGDKYLNYEVLRNASGDVISPDTPSMLVEEKNGKEEITLPNGKKITNLPAEFVYEKAPIIIYDVSLKANDDYESTGTH